VADVGQRHRFERGAQVREAHSGRAHHPATRVPRVDDSAVVDLGPRREVVREPELAVGAQLFEVVEFVGRRVVVVREAALERALQHGARDRLGRDPRHRGDRGLDSHA
jgi:hypothetical protein